MRFDLQDALLLGVLVAAVSGCSWDEQLIIENLKGTVRVPRSAATRMLLDDKGKAAPVTDVALIGPIYLGLYPSVEPANVIELYPHPEVGPQYIEGQQGNAYPYGGTTVGDLRFACFESLSCKVTSGRFASWQKILDWFEQVGEPVLDNFGQPITNAELLRQTCFDLLDVTSDEEMRITGDLDFVENGDFFDAEFTIWQQEFFYDVDQEGCTPGKDCKGMSLWGWMDAPGTTEYSFSTCDPTFGFDTEVYDAEFRAGSVVSDVLNFPASRISGGDWVASEPYQWDDVNAEPVLVLDFEVQ